MRWLLGGEGGVFGWGFFSIVLSIGYTERSSFEAGIATRNPIGKGGCVGHVE